MEIKKDNKTLIKQQKQEIFELQFNYAQAKNEINNLIRENLDLKRQIEEGYDLYREKVNLLINKRCRKLDKYIRNLDKNNADVKEIKNIIKQMKVYFGK